MDGIHLLGEWYGCAADLPEMTDANAFAYAVPRACRGILGHDHRRRTISSIRTRRRRGTYCSPIASGVHTWPEHGFVTIDVYVCNYTTDNSAKAQRLFDTMQSAFRPEHANAHSIHRGGAMPEEAPRDLAPGLLTEYLTEDTGYFVRSSREFEHFQSPFQAVEVHETRQYGKLFRLDGHFMTSEKDEFFYHENLVHLAANAHPSPETALISAVATAARPKNWLKHPTAMESGDAGRDRPCRARRRAKVPGKKCITAPDDRASTSRSKRLRRTSAPDRDLRSHRARPDHGSRRPSEPLYPSDFYRA